MIFFSSPYLIPNPTRSFDHNWDFPKAFWKESRRLLIAAVLSLTAAEVARPFAVYHMESNTSLFMASPDDTTVRGDWKPSSIYQLYGRRSELRRPKIIVHIYLKVVGLKERKALYHASAEASSWRELNSAQTVALLSAPNGLKYISGSFCDIYCLILETAAMPKLSLSNLDDNK